MGELVHNLEHGYYILWYDDTVLEDAELLGQVRALAESNDGATPDPAMAPIFAAWTSGKDRPSRTG